MIVPPCALSSHPREPSHAPALAADAQRAVGDPRRQRGPHLDPAQRHVQPRAPPRRPRAARSSARHARRPSCGRPCRASRRAPSPRRAPEIVVSGSGLSSFVRGSGASYSLAGRCRRGAEEGPKVRSHCAARPSASARPLAPAGPKWLSPIVSQSPGARVGERLLDRARLAAGLEQRAPQRAGGRAAGALEDRVADPGAAAAGGVRGAQVVGLVVALVGRDGGEARLAHRFPWRSPSHSHSG